MKWKTDSCGLIFIIMALAGTYAVVFKENENGFILLIMAGIGGLIRTMIHDVFSN